MSAGDELLDCQVPQSLWLPDGRCLDLDGTLHDAVPGHYTHVDVWETIAARSPEYAAHWALSAERRGVPLPDLGCQLPDDVDAHLRELRGRR